MYVLGPSRSMLPPLSPLPSPPRFPERTPKEEQKEGYQAVDLESQQVVEAPKVMTVNLDPYITLKCHEWT